MPSVSAWNTPDDVVDGRVVSTLLVAVVEAVDVKQEDPERQRCREEDDLPRGNDRVDPRDGRRKGQGNGIRGNEADDVRGEQESSHEPAAVAETPEVAARASRRRPVR